MQLEIIKDDLFNDEFRLTILVLLSSACEEEATCLRRDVGPEATGIVHVGSRHRRCNLPSVRDPSSSLPLLHPLPLSTSFSVVLTQILGRFSSSPTAAN